MGPKPKQQPRASEMYTPPHTPVKEIGLVDISEKRESSDKTASDLRQIELHLKQLLKFKDIDALRIVLATVAAHRLKGTPVWLILVGPPSGAKTELIQALNLVSGIYPISDLTDKTFASGAMRDNGADASLLARVENGVLTLKDFTTILSMRRDKRKEVLAQLREIHDGEYRKDFGTGKRFEWRGRITVITGVTHEIDRHYGAMGALGQRFVLLRVRQPDRYAAALHAIDTNNDTDRLREELQALIGQFFTALDLSGDGPTTPQRYKTQLAALAEFCTRARTPTVRSMTRAFEYAPDDPEGSPRLAKQLHSLARGLAAIEGRSEINAADMDLVKRVAIDSLPTHPRTVILDLAGRTSTTVADLEQRHRNISRTTLERALEDLEAFQIVERLHGKTVTEPELWQLSSDARGIVGIASGDLDAAA